MRKLKSEEEFLELQKEILNKIDPLIPTLVICAGTGCMAYGCHKIKETALKKIKDLKLENKIKVLATGCLGFCERGTIIIIQPEGIFYQRVKEEDIEEIIEETLLNKHVVERLLYTDPLSGKKIIYEKDIPFYKKQNRLLLENNFKIDPAKIEDYLAVSGYSALIKAFKMSPQEIINQIKASGLRGRGGGGFPTGIKWQSCRDAHEEIKYVICNADEGDPGAFMDRALLEGNPHSILEGMIIGAYAISANQGFVYVRNEYPLALKNIEIAILQAREYGFLGENILTTGFNFDLKINRGGGAFVAGESSALMCSLEGKVAEPRAKYVHTVEKGIFDRPSCLNNVETWANIPLIINRGALWYNKIGAKGSAGTKIFSLVGKINNTGLVEVPMGMTLREIIFEIGGGIPKGKKFKAVQTGGPSGGCIPESLLDLPVDFDELTKVGSMMGSGGIIVMDEDTCMVDVAKYFLNFLKDESCGKCVPCREGIRRMLETLEKITQGKGRQDDLNNIQELAEVVIDTSLCALGSSAPNPFLSTLRYFKEEYLAHLEGKCLALQCKSLIQFEIDNNNCTGCQVCLKACPSDAITGEKKKAHIINLEKCIKCGICFEVCKFQAVVKKTGVKVLV